MALQANPLTDMWMVDPTMFDPTQRSNQFSNYNNAPLPWPPSYSGAPTDAMGRPIQSFQAWQQANPGGTTLNNTAAQPQAAPAAPPMYGPSNPPPGGSMFAGDPNNPGFTYAQERAMSPAAQYSQVYAKMPGPQSSGWGNTGGGGGGYGPAIGELAANQYYGSGAGSTLTPQAAPQAQGPPNNWQAALNALSNPGNPVTPGATVPLAVGYQPAGGVNQAFLNQAGAGQGMNQNFLSALRAIQGR